MATVEMIPIGLGGSEFNGIHSAPLLPNPDDSAALSQRFRRLLTATPQHFMEAIEVEGHPLVRLQWVSLCQTAGLVLLRSGDPLPDVYCLLLNGLEDTEKTPTRWSQSGVMRRCSTHGGTASLKPRVPSPSPATPPQPDAR